MKQPCAPWPSHAAGDQQVELAAAPPTACCQHSSLAVVLTIVHSLDPDPTVEENPSQQDFWDCFSVHIGRSCVGELSVFNHVLVKVSDGQYSGDFPVSTGHCSAKGCGHMDISGHLYQSCDTARMHHVVTGLRYYYTSVSVSF